MPQLTSEQENALRWRLFGWLSKAQFYADAKNIKREWIEEPKDLITELEAQWEKHGLPDARKATLFTETELAARRSPWILAWFDFYACRRLQCNSLENFKRVEDGAFYLLFVKHFEIRIKTVSQQ